MNRFLLSFLVAATLTCATGCPGLFPPPDDGPYEATVVVQWNEAMLAAVRNGPPRPTVIARSLHVVHAAMYEAWAPYDSKANGWRLGNALRRPAAERTDANKRAAISYAAYRALVDQFPAYEENTGAFSSLLQELGYPLSESMDATTPAGIGNVAAQAVLDYRQEDGSNEGNNYAQITSDTYPTLYAPVNSADPESTSSPGGVDFNRNRWQPLRVPNGMLLDADGNPIADNDDPTTFTDQSFLTPHWGAVVPFALRNGRQFRPPPPPYVGSNEPYTDALGRVSTNEVAYNFQVDQIVDITAGLTDRQKAIAEYWADGPRSETPPGHWHALAHGVSWRDRHTIDEDVKLYFALSAAVFDSSISCWEAKRFYDYIRPQSAIRHRYTSEMIRAWGGPNQGTQRIPGSEWRPYQSLSFVTPPFAEYTSGHSTFSASAAEILTRFTGSNRFYDGVTELTEEDFNRDGVPDMLGQHIVPVGGLTFEDGPSEVIVLRWNTFQDAANEAGISRRYGGIHFQDGDLRAREIGRKIGALVYERAAEYWNGER